MEEEFAGDTGVERGSSGQIGNPTSYRPAAGKFKFIFKFFGKKPRCRLVFKFTGPSDPAFELFELKNEGRSGVQAPSGPEGQLRWPRFEPFGLKRWGAVAG